MIGLRGTFKTPYSQHAHRSGQSFTVVSEITEPDDMHDAEVLPMYRIRFEDGSEIEAWPEEVKTTADELREIVERIETAEREDGEALTELSGEAERSGSYYDYDEQRLDFAMRSEDRLSELLAATRNFLTTNP